MKNNLKNVGVICAIIVFVSFWLPWIKANEMINFFSEGGVISISGAGLIECANSINKLSEGFFGESLNQLKIFYIYVLIPLLSGLIVYAFIFKKEKLYKMSSIIGFFVISLLCVGSIIYLNVNNEIKEALSIVSTIGIGFVLTLSASGFGFIYLFINRKEIKFVFDDDKNIINNNEVDLQKRINYETKDININITLIK